MRAYGAKVTLTPAEQAMEGARDYAEAEYAKGGCVMLNQFANPDNPLAHFETTGAACRLCIFPVFYVSGAGLSLMFAAWCNGIPSKRHGDATCCWMPAFLSDQLLEMFNQGFMPPPP